MTAGYEIQKRHRLRHPERARARDAVKYAVRVGDLIPEPCRCGEARVEAHHHQGYDPAHKLDVLWLCRRHHRALHQRSPEAREAGRQRKLAYMRAYARTHREANREAVSRYRARFGSEDGAA